MNNLLSLMGESTNIALANRVREMIADGKPVLQLQTGDPDFATPQPIVQTLIKALHDGNTHYCASSGLAQLKSAVAMKLIEKNKFKQAHSTNVSITHGAVQAIQLSLASIINPGDEVVLIAPFWLAYQSDALLAGAKVKILKTQMSAGFIPDLTELASLLSTKTKAIIINSPNNPTGAMYPVPLLKELAEICRKRDIYIISDEVYEDIIFNTTHTSIQAVAPDYQKIISVFSFSKSYAMTGWRVGYLYSNAEIAKQVNKLLQFQSTCLNPASQLAAVCALQDPQVAKLQTEQVDTYAHRRAKILDKIQGTWLEKSTSISQGTFYIWVNISRFNLSAIEFCELLLEQHKLSLTPGNAFGENYHDFIRFTFSTNLSDIMTALDILIALEI
ncbi:hypothetical protein CKO50_11165 [Pseudoalteromonas sp. HM-SA03]|uniref:pyridoxal phosphate-dependent aminotransferase n=1 Tax=Pseudoalteromonas sp. HM-SA03 TaxID=2029678 RepID=UPI000BADDE33|nr:aminotransferase class I/II-fold pyridoxal phosphate-dependent enzyme [Pseudoalteromonas sp. HM-SA03]PAY01277.1 hypothetical protein CKO50_11165 [Pseudoalteromonas sp. HM-SA03]